MAASGCAGNLHAHTTRSDGSHTPQQLIDAYAGLGYDFLGISDHDMHISPRELAAIDAHGMVLIGCNEITADGPHLLHINADRTIEPSWQRQKSIDDAAAHSESLVVCNHPNWWQNFDHCPLALLQQWTGYHGIEIFNGGINFIDGSGYALDKWDMLLSTPRPRIDSAAQMDRRVSSATYPRIWGFAHDDTHSARDVGQGWLMVYALERSVKGIVAAIREGRFYASTGVVIKRIFVDQQRIRMETENAERIVCSGLFGRRLEISDAAHIEVDVPHDAVFVRFTCFGRGERYAWTQPVWVGR